MKRIQKAKDNHERPDYWLAALNILVNLFFEAVNHFYVIFYYYFFPLLSIILQYDEYFRH